MAEEEVIVPTSGNPALNGDAVSGLVARMVGDKLSDTRADKTFETRLGYYGGKHWSERAEEAEKNRRRSLTESDRQKEDTEAYWAKRRDRRDRLGQNEERPKAILSGGYSGGGDGGRARIARFGIGNSSSVEYAQMRFKSKTMQEACSPKFTCAFPMNTHLPQVCGPFRPITLSSQGGLPQSSLQESIGTGIIPNMDA